MDSLNLVKEDEEEVFYKKFLFNPGSIVEDKSIINLLSSHLIEISNLMKTGNSHFNSENRFIGTHPISLDRRNIHNLKENNYVVCEKTDGVRYLLIILNDGSIYLHGRKMSFDKKTNQKELQFFIPNIKIPLNFQIKNSPLKIRFLFDGELVVDTYQKKKEIKFLIFDTIISESQTVFFDDYIMRLEDSRKFLSLLKFSKCLINSLDNVTSKYFNYEKNQPRIKMSLKDFFNLEDCQFLLEVYLKHLPHKQDGLIFTRIDCPYKSGLNEGILKWKDSTKQSIDFLLKNNNNFKNFFVLDLYLISYDKKYKKNSLVLFDFMVVNQETYEKIANNMNKAKGVITECVFNEELDNKFVKSIFTQYPDYYVDFLWDQAIYSQKSNFFAKKTFENNINFYISNNFKGGWQFYGEGWRLDKDDPNALKVGKSIMDAIREPIDLKYLLDFIRV